MRSPASKLGQIHAHTHTPLSSLNTRDLERRTHSYDTAVLTCMSAFIECMFTLYSTTCIYSCTQSAHMILIGAELLIIYRMYRGGASEPPNEPQVASRKAPLTQWMVCDTSRNDIQTEY